MDQVNLGYSTKNIPIPGKKEYLQRLINSAEKFVRAIRWRTHFFLNPNKNKNKKETYGFPSTKSPPNIPELKLFEDGILDLIQNSRKQVTIFKQNFQRNLMKF